jgi:ribosome maturation protein SDO1
MLEAKKQQIITYIAANAINPQTHTPHPPMRIQLALEEAKFHVDPFKPLDKEIDEAMKLLRPLLPIRFEKSRIAIKLNGSDYGRCFDDLISFGVVEREEWTADGSWIGVMEIPAGLINDLTDKLKHKTKGSASVKLIN